MGRHSSPRQWRYYLSILKYALPWILAAVVGVSAVWAGVGALGDDELDPSKGPVVSESEGPRPRGEPTTRRSFRPICKHFANENFRAEFPIGGKHSARTTDRDLGKRCALRRPDPGSPVTWDGVNW